MTLRDQLMDKYEKFLAGLELDELYLFRGFTIERKGQAELLEKIDKKIVYEENKPKSLAETLSPYLEGGQ